MKNKLYFALIATLALFPLLILVGYAFAPGWRFPDVIPARFNMQGFDYVFGQWKRILEALGSSLLFSILTVFTTLALCIIPAHHLARAQFKGKSLVEGLLLAPALVPPMTFSMGVHFAFIKLGLIDTTLGVVLVLSTFSYPYMLRALVAGYQSFGEEYELCARNLGAGWWTVLSRVDMPLLMPAMVAGSTVVFLVAFSEYFLVFLIGGGRVASYTGYLFPFLTSSDRSAGAILTLIFLLVPLILFVLMELFISRRYRARGLA